MELLPGCPNCFYFRSRWADVRKHCMRQHGGQDIDQLPDAEGVRWGLTSVDETKVKPTYSGLQESDVCLYPLEREEMTVHQTTVVGTAVLKDVSVESSTVQEESWKTFKSRHSRESHSEPSSSVVDDRRRSKSSKSRRTSSSPPVRTKPDKKVTVPSKVVDVKQVPTDSSEEDSGPREQKDRASRVKSSRSAAARTRGKPSPQVQATVTQAPLQPSVEFTAGAPSTSTPVRQKTSLKRRRVDTQNLDMSELSTPTTPGASFSDSFHTPRRSARFSQRLAETSTPGTMETVSELSSPVALRIPALDPETDTPSERSPTPVPEVVEERLDPRDFPEDTIVRPVPQHSSSQTDLHLEPDDVVLVVPHGGGRLWIK